MTRLTIAACIAAIVATAGMAIAQDYANIVVGGDTVARIRTAGPHGSIYQRQARIDQRVVQALAEERPSIFVQETGVPDLDVYQSEGRWTLSIGNTMLIQAYPEDAVGTTTRALIEQWKLNFQRQLPRAVSPIHVPSWWQDPHAEEGGAVSGQREHGAATEDLPLVREVAGILQAARETNDDEFEEMLPAMERAMLQTVWTYRHPNCGAAPITESIRARSVLKRAKGLEEPNYRYEKYWLAKVTIDRLRDAMDMPEGVGPIPEERDLPDFEAPIPPDDGGIASDPEATEPAAIAEPTLVRGTSLTQVAIGTGLGRDNALLNVGQEFDADTSQLMVYLQTDGAPQNTIVGVTIQKDDGIVARRLVRVSGDRRMAVTFYPARTTAFAPGDYEVRLSVNGEDAGIVPFRIGTE
ncbi:MAG: hypothetical protein R6V07_02030 [Armatimonadota bacterium]